jgi:Na+/melibiose symporter-like transporter
MAVSPRYPSRTIQILYSEEYFVRVCLRLFLTVFSTESFLATVYPFFVITTLGRKSVSYYFPAICLIQSDTLKA